MGFLQSADKQQFLVCSTKKSSNAFIVCRDPFIVDSEDRVCLVDFMGEPEGGSSLPHSRLVSVEFALSIRCIDIRASRVHGATSSYKNAKNSCFCTLKCAEIHFCS